MIETLTVDEEVEPDPTFEGTIKDVRVGHGVQSIECLRGLWRCVADEAG